MRPNRSRPSDGVNRVTYNAWQLPPVDPRALLETLVVAGRAEYYWFYESDTETRLALDAIGEVVVEDGLVRSTWGGEILAEEPATDPFAQVGNQLAAMPVNQWRVFGYITFDTAGYYYPYPFRSSGPQIRFVVPQAEVIITATSTTVRTVLDPEKLVTSVKSIPEYTYARPNAPALDSADREVYEQHIANLLVDISAGRLTKAIVARRVELPGSIDVFGTLHAGRHTNPSGRTFAFHQPELTGVGSSPEVLMETDGSGGIITISLAGTRPRGKSVEEDQRLKRELTEDPKEIKEHSMSAQLAQEELKSVCRAGTVHIDGDYFYVAAFRTVQHLASKVKGQLASGQTLWDGLRALFPGVTVSGVDKYSAIARIAALEQRARGPYAGAVGWVDATGKADLAIALRSAFEDATGVSMSAGAGIISESIPEREYDETVDKLRTIQEQLVLRPSRGRLETGSGGLVGGD